MKTTKEIALIGMYTALLIGAQLVLSAIAGVEIVTVLLLCFCYVFGRLRGVAVATAFSLLRCLIFGFYPNVVLLYLIYYNVFALIFGGLGKLFDRKTQIKHLVVVVVGAVVVTACFTLLDDLLMAIMCGFNRKVAVAYFYSSIYVLVPQCVCALLTVSVFFIPLCNLYNKFNESLVR